MESEHSMAREDRDGSGVEMEFMAISPGFSWEVFLGWQGRKARTDPSQLSLRTGIHYWVNVR
jgi:hypothetical protein